MRRSLTASTAAAGLCVVFSCAVAAVAQTTVGGYKPADQADPEVVAAAEFAVGAQKEKQGGPLSLVSVSRAETQVVAGRNYRLCLEVKAADEADAEVESETVRAVVYQNLQRAYSLKSWEAADCAGGDAEGHHASSSAARPADPVTSVYSSLSGCKTVSTDAESGSSTQACRGVGGYNLRLEYGDARESITVISPDGKQHPLNFWEVISTGFSSVGKKAEWRVTKKRGRAVPSALIVRFDASENPEDSSKVTSYLVVAKITPAQICVTDKIGPSATANEEARRAADASAGKPCLAAPAQNH